MGFKDIVNEFWKKGGDYMAKKKPQKQEEAKPEEEKSEEVEEPKKKTTSEIAETVEQNKKDIVWIKTKLQRIL